MREGDEALSLALSSPVNADPGAVLSEVLTITDNPLCRGVHSAEPCCDYYLAVFEVLFRTLVHRGATVAETACEACGDPACTFEIRW